jgi:DNA topoisomerase I
MIDGKKTARTARLTYVSDEAPGIRRRRAGSGFVYLDRRGHRVSSVTTLARIRSLAVPPAWTNVWICPTPVGHLQATGRDARGRKQYRYHDEWRALRDRMKYDHVLRLAEHLPAIRARVDRDLRRRGLSRDTVIAAVVRLLDRSLIRVGNDEYLRENGSFGLTTLRERHVGIRGDTIRFRFRGKSGAHHSVEVADARVARLLRKCLALPGAALFRYLDEAGEPRTVDSDMVNEYLHRITGEDFTAKDFRTWHGTVLAAMALQELERFDTRAGAKRNIRNAIQKVAARLGNTPTICRKCYVHPEIITTYIEGSLLLAVKDKVEEELRDDLATLRPEEAAVLALLQEGLSLTLKDKLEASIEVA